MNTDYRKRFYVDYISPLKKNPIYMVCIFCTACVSYFTGCASYCTGCVSYFTGCVSYCTECAYYIIYLV